MTNWARHGAGAAAMAALFGLGFGAAVAAERALPRSNGQASRSAGAASPLQAGQDLSPHPLPEPGPAQGREAVAPTRIPLRGWKRIMVRTYEAIAKDRVMAVAAGVTFFMLLAMVPTLTAFVSLYGLFAARETVFDHLRILDDIVPAEIMPVIVEQMTRIANSSATTMTFASLFSLAVALWSANGGMKAMIEALNVAYDETEKRSFVKLTLISFGLTLAAFSLMFVLFAAVAVLPAIVSFFPVLGTAEIVTLLLRWPVMMLVLMMALSVLYRLAPSRASARWVWVSPGAVVATGLLVVSSMLFSVYARNFANFNETYGSLGAIMGLMLWLWVVCLIVLMGAELNSETEKQTNRDSTTGPEQPMGERGARAADVVAR